MLEKRIIELEIKAVYQEDLLQALNQVVSRQQQQIERLEKTCQLLHERMNSLVNESQDSPENSFKHEIPPHY